MKKGLTGLLALLLCVSLAGCGGNAEPNDGNEWFKQENTADVQDNVNAENQKKSSAEVSQGQSLPMNIDEVYQCTLDGMEGYIRVTSYEIFPDEMNEGFVIRDLSIDIVFYNVPESFDLSAVVFTMNGKAEAVDEGAWLVPLADGNEDVVFAYNNASLYTSYEDGVYVENILISYMMPESYHELGVAIVGGNRETTLDSITMEEVVDQQSCWFMMGNLD